jgi:hypothetical protein
MRLEANGKNRRDKDKAAISFIWSDDVIFAQLPVADASIGGRSFFSGALRCRTHISTSRQRRHLRFTCRWNPVPTISKADPNIGQFWGRELP